MDSIITKENNMTWIHLQEISINSDQIVDVNWGKDEVAAEVIPGGATELANPSAGVESPKVAVIRYGVQYNDSPLSLVIDRTSDDFKTLKQALGKS